MFAIWQEAIRTSDCNISAGHERCVTTHGLVQHKNVADVCPVLRATQFKQGQEFTCTPGAYTILPVVLNL